MFFCCFVGKQSLALMIDGVCRIISRFAVLWHVNHYKSHPEVEVEIIQKLNTKYREADQ